MEGADVWDMFIKQMSLDDLAISVTDNRGILAVAKVKKPGNSVAEGPEGLLSSYNAHISHLVDVNILILLVMT